MDSTPNPPTRFREMTRGDLPTVLQIEKLSFPEPWGRARFVESLAVGSPHVCQVLEAHSGVVGYYVLEPGIKAYHILNLALHPAHRRQGHASRALERIEAGARLAFGSREPVPAAAAPGASRNEWTRMRDDEVTNGDIVLEVAESNLAAQLLYRKLGYRATRILRNYYAAQHEDAYRMVKKT